MGRLEIGENCRQWLCARFSAARVWNDATTLLSFANCAKWDLGLTKVIINFNLSQTQKLLHMGRNLREGTIL